MADREIPPGHLGNLTPEQEQKFLQLWGMLLMIFSEPTPASPTTTTTAATRKGSIAASTTSLSSTAPASPVKEKKRSRWWGGSTSSISLKSTATDASAASPASPNASAASFAGLEGDDKWGMNKEFQAALRNYTPRQLQAAFYNGCKNEDPDAFLLRYLRARKWDVNKAFVMLVSTLQFRLGMYRVDSEIMARGEAGSLADSKSAAADAKTKKGGTDFINLLNLGHSFVHRTDLQGRPVCYIRVRMHKIGAYAQSSVERYTIWMIETARLLMARHVETAAIVFDMTGFGLSNMDYTAVKFIIQCFEANYPESLGVVLVHKAPWIFSSAWALIKGWLDPVVAAKVHFTKTDEELLQFIPKENLLKELGGQEASEYHYTPVVPGEDRIMQDAATREKLQAARDGLRARFEELTRQLIEAAKDAKKSSEADVPALKTQRRELADQLISAYWDLDPYVRARTVYDRLHLLRRSDGKEYPPAIAAADDRTVVTGVPDKSATPSPITEKGGLVAEPAAPSPITTATNGTTVH
ncbi:hypothetical protein KEM52_001161 [Ascosphaera acerosa]|nr:hypothetical protein KEM52_001161 [Ascosphaera acerosa]